MALSLVEGLSCYRVVFDQGLHVRSGQACAGLGGDVFSWGMYTSYQFLVGTAVSNMFCQVQFFPRKMSIHGAGIEVHESSIEPILHRFCNLGVCASC